MVERGAPHLHVVGQRLLQALGKLAGRVVRAHVVIDERAQRQVRQLRLSQLPLLRFLAVGPPHT